MSDKVATMVRLKPQVKEELQKSAKKKNMSLSAYLENRLTEGVGINFNNCTFNSYNDNTFNNYTSDTGRTPITFIEPD